MILLTTTDYRNRADGTRWNEAPKPGYNPLGKARDAN